jgi:phage terminase large subunit-like protein
MAAPSYAATARRYAEAVVFGKIPAGKWVRLACKRQLDDLNRFSGKGSPYQFNPKLRDRTGKAFRPANNVCAFIERLLHIKGPLAGQLIKLEPWQVFILTTVFGCVKPTGNRRFRRSYVEVPRGNGKSAISSAAGLYMPTADGELGAEAYR